MNPIITEEQINKKIAENYFKNDTICRNLFINEACDNIKYIVTEKGNVFVLNIKKKPKEHLFALYQISR